MPMKSLIDHFADNPYSVEIRIPKPLYEVGEEVQVRLRNGGNWYDAVVRYSYCQPYIVIDDEKGCAHVECYVWKHYCTVTDERVATKSVTVLEHAHGTSNDIQYE